MSWQKCPSCEGKGFVPDEMLLISSSHPCTVCKGAKIISELTGEPPASKKKPFEVVSPMKNFKIKKI